MTDSATRRQWEAVGAWTWLRRAWVSCEGRGVRAPATSRQGRWFAPAVCALLLVGVPAAAEKPRISVIPFGHSDLERQLRGALCTDLACVPASAVTVKGRLDWRKVSAEQLTGVVKAKIARDAATRHRILDVEVAAGAKVLLVRKKVPLAAATLSTANLRALQADLVGVIRRAHGPGEDRPALPPAAVAAPPLAAAPGTPPVVPPPPPPAQLTEPTAVAPPEPAEPAAAAAPRAEVGTVQAERGPPLLEVQPTLGLLHRTFEVGSGSGAPSTLRSTSVPTSAQPGIYLALYPLRSREGLFASLGLEGTASASVGMQVQRENDPSGTLFPAVAFGASLALRCNLRLGPVTLGPVAGWQLYNFDVHPSSSGEVLTGQPAVHWRAWTPGLKVEVNLGRWEVFAEGRYLYIYSVGPLQSSGAFSSFTAAPSFDAAVGFGVRFTPDLQLRFAFAFARYAIQVPVGASTTQVNGVTDQLVGGSLSVRYSL
jgi:hypothetical protein